VEFRTGQSRVQVVDELLGVEFGIDDVIGRIEVGVVGQVLRRLRANDSR
jgi:hypothetical protein